MSDFFYLVLGMGIGAVGFTIYFIVDEARYNLRSRRR